MAIKIQAKMIAMPIDALLDRRISEATRRSQANLGTRRNHPSGFGRLRGTDVGDVSDNDEFELSRMVTILVRSLITQIEYVDC